MRALAVALTLALVLAACAPELELGARWRPLERVVERSSTPADMVLTVRHEVFVHDLGDWKRHSLAELDAVLEHEQQHALRQLSDGTGGERWLKTYANDPRFRWAEERVGWRAEILAYQRAGIPIAPATVAQFLTSHYGAMVGYAEALAWVDAVIDGKE